LLRNTNTYEENYYVRCTYIIHGNLFAQDSTLTRSTFTAGVEFNSVPIVDASAPDSSGSSLSIAPYLKFQFHSGIGVKAQAYLLTSGTQPGYYLTAVSPFYAVTIKKCNWIFLTPISFSMA